jgi:hypothetical protein
MMARLIKKEKLKALVMVDLRMLKDDLESLKTEQSKIYMNHIWRAERVANRLVD